MEWGNKIKKIVKEQDAKLKISILLDELEKKINESLEIENYDVSDYVRKKYESYFDEIVNNVVPELNEYKEEKGRFLSEISRYFNLSLDKEKRIIQGYFLLGMEIKMLFLNTYILKFTL